MRNRGARVTAGLITLVLFIVGTYLHVSNSPTTGDIDSRGNTLPMSSSIGANTPGQTEPDSVQAEATPEPTPEATPEPTVDPNSPEGRALAKGLPAPPEIDITSWEYILVNSTHELSSDYAPPEVVKVSSSGCPQDSRIVDALTSFTNDCAAQGLSVYLSSGYRSYNEQYSTFQNKLNQGYSREAAAKIVAPPGTSEHQTGLCCDITDYYRNPKVPSEIEPTQTFQWLNEHCAEYGFILRYPDGKGDITGIIYEPWHFRYVGVEVAEYIKANDLTLEEFVALYTGEEVPGAE